MKKIFFYGLTLIILSSCGTTAPLVKLTPSTLENKDYWNMGQQFVCADNKNILFDCAFNRMENNKVIFDVRITNQSDSLVLVDPALFEATVYKNDSIRLGNCNAYDPEIVLAELKVDENRAIARANRSTGLSILSSLVTAGAAFAIAASDEKPSQKEKKLNKLAFGNDMVQIAVAANAGANNMRAERNWTQHRDLSEAFLRKTTLPKGYFIDGEVHFPYYKKALWYDLRFNVGNAVAYFYFEQALIRSREQIAPMK